MALNQLQKYIAADPNLFLMSSVTSIEEAPDICEKLVNCDILFLDIIVTGGDITELMPCIRNVKRMVIISALSMHEIPAYIQELHPEFLTKPITPKRFSDCIVHIMDLQ